MKKQKAAAPAPLVVPSRLAEPWSAKQRRVLLLLVIACSLVERGVYFAQIAPTPLAFAHRWDQSDMHTFHLWGQSLAQGDWLTRKATAPLHWWQTRMAQQWLDVHPEALAGVPETFEHLEGTRSAPADRLYLHWARGLTFYQEPLYPYLVGLTYWLTKPDPRFVFAWQLLLGVISNVLLVLLARAAFGDVVSAVTGLLAVLCAPLLFYELLLLRESLIVFFGLLLLWVWSLAQTRTAKWWLLTGVCWGLGVLLKNTFLVVGLVLAAVHVWRSRDRTAAALMLAGLIAVAVPVVARNVAVGVSPFALAGNGAVTFLTVNTADYPSARGGFFLGGKDNARIMGERDGAFGGVVRATLATHPSVGHFLGMKWDMFSAAWRWFEHPNNESFYFFRDAASVLRLPVTFFVLGPLALVGLVLARKRREALSLYVLALTSLVPLVLFYSIGRLRLPLLSVCLPFAALTVVSVARALSEQRVAVGAGLSAAVLACGWWTSWMPSPPIQLSRAVDWQLPWRGGLGDTFEGARASKDHSTAAEAALQALTYEPAWLRERPTLEATPEGLEYFSTVHRAVAIELRALGRDAEAAQHEAIGQRQGALLPKH